MCTLIVWFRCFDGVPLLVAANRDEQLARPAAPPALETRSGTAILAPRDLTAGGTWIGVNAGEVFAGITNRFGMERDPSVRSRGLLVLDALSGGRAREAAAAIAARDPRGENGFHLVVADRESAHVVWNDRSRIVHRELEPGVHVLTERSFDAAPTAREPLLHRLIAGLEGAPDDEALRALLATHTPSPLDSVCVHAPEHGYGTRSSTIVRFGPHPGDARFAHAEGTPCLHGFTGYTLPA